MYYRFDKYIFLSKINLININNWDMFVNKHLLYCFVNEILRSILWLTYLSKSSMRLILTEHPNQNLNISIQKGFYGKLFFKFQTMMLQLRAWVCIYSRLMIYNLDTKANIQSKLNGPLQKMINLNCSYFGKIKWSHSLWEN